MKNVIAKAILGAGVLALFIGCSSDNGTTSTKNIKDANYYLDHPEELKEKIKQCMKENRVDIECDYARQANDRLPWSNPYEKTDPKVYTGWKIPGDKDKKDKKQP